METVRERAGRAQMATFTEEEWTRFDFWTLVTARGLATVELGHRESCLAWLSREGYAVHTIDCAADEAQVQRQFSAWLRFPELFGHEWHGGLDALNDGFGDIVVPDDGGLVLELSRVDVWHERCAYDAENVLQIASCVSQARLALGLRFFTVCTVPTDARIIGATVMNIGAPPPWRVYGKRDPFV